MSGIPDFDLYCEQFHRGEKYFSGVAKQNPPNVESTGDYSTILTKEAIRHINVRNVNLLENAIH
jgi:hypothetical protein